MCTDDLWSAAGACTHEFCARQAAAEALATEVMSIPYVISAVGTPFIGLAVDRFGGRALLAALCPLMLVIAHVLLGFVATLPPELPLVLQGVAFAFFATALWPSVPYTVPAESEGLAFGVVTALQNGGLGLFPLLVSLVYDASGQRYDSARRARLRRVRRRGLAAGLALNLYDCTHDHQLNRSNYLKAKPATAGSTIGEQLGSTRALNRLEAGRARELHAARSPFSSGTGRSRAVDLICVRNLVLYLGQQVTATSASGDARLALERSSEPRLGEASQVALGVKLARKRRRARARRRESSLTSASSSSATGGPSNSEAHWRATARRRF